MAMVATKTALWLPTPDDLNRSTVARFIKVLNQKLGLQLQSYHELHSFSVDPKTSPLFWMSLFDFLNIGETVKPSKAFEENGGRMFPPPLFFPDARLNFSGSVLNNRDPNSTCLLEVEEGTMVTTQYTWGMLYSHVQKIADSMISSGVRQGDRVAAVVANNELAVALALAALSIGAIWSSISPDLGVKGILDRLLQVTPKLVFAECVVIYNGKTRNLFSRVEEWAEGLADHNSLANIVLLPSETPFNGSKVSKSISFDSFLARGRGRKLQFTQLPFNAPAFIYYTSGTTGPPKCILHTAGGVLIQSKKDYTLSIDLGESDTFFQYTTTSWIMWALLLCNLEVGAKVVLYPGSPFYPDNKTIPRILEQLKVTVFGTSAKYLTELRDQKAKPRVEFDLSSLRKVTSTGSILPADVATWFYADGFPTQAQLLSCSGGTDCASSVICGSPLLPIYAGEIAAKALGMAVDVFATDQPDGQSVVNLQQAGELVCTQPFPSQPLTFWGNNGLERYQKAYYEKFGPRVWAHGDLLRITQDTQGIIMLGRSDGVLNPSGVRFGSAEIYNILRQVRDIEDSVCVGQRRPHDTDESVILFVKLQSWAQASKNVKEHIREIIATELSRRHVPKYIFFVADIPYTVNGKKLETLVRDIVCGRKAESSVVENPESLAIFHKYYNVEKEAAMELERLSKL